MIGRYRLRVIPRAALAAVAALCAQAQAEVYESEEHRFRVVTVVEGVKHPWSIAFLPDGDMLFTQRTGELRLVRDGRLLDQPLAGVPDALVRGQGGLQEVAVHPDFEVNRIVYLSYSKAEDDRNTTALVRARLEGDRLHQVEEIFEANAWSAAPGHYGAKIAFDGNGHLFLSVGDRMAQPRGNLESHPAQALGSHAGAIVRLREDGAVPDDNPFAGQPGALPEIWSYGHRNPQGLDYHPATGRLWSTEHGPQGGDELNLILPGLNYGWPVIGFGVNYGAGTPIHASSEREGMEQPDNLLDPVHRRFRPDRVRRRRLSRAGAATCSPGGWPPGIAACRASARTAKAAWWPANRCLRTSTGCATSARGRTASSTWPPTTAAAGSRTSCDSNRRTEPFRAC